MNPQHCSGILDPPHGSATQGVEPHPWSFHEHQRGFLLLGGPSVHSLSAKVCSFQNAEMHFDLELGDLLSTKS